VRFTWWWRRHNTVSVRHRLAGRELLLSSRYTVPLRCSYCWRSREHEFLDLREFLRVIELLRAVQENSLVYSKKMLHGQFSELKFILCTGQLQGPKFCKCYSGRRLWPMCRFDAGNKTLSAKTCTSPPPPQIIPKSCDLLLMFPCLFPAFLGRLFVPDSFRTKNKAKPNFILEISKRYAKYLIKTRNNQLYVKYGEIKSL
jgi:hypothetical protein